MIYFAIESLMRMERFLELWEQVIYRDDFHFTKVDECALEDLLNEKTWVSPENALKIILRWSREWVVNERSEINHAISSLKALTKKYAKSLQSISNHTWDKLIGEFGNNVAFCVDLRTVFGSVEIPVVMDGNASCDYCGTIHLEKVEYRGKSYYERHGLNEQYHHRVYNHK
jgi:hypothetical protein